MRAVDFHDFTRRRPFVPFRLHASDGRIYDIRHPDSIIPMATKVIVGIVDESGVPDRAEHIGMNHVLRLEELADASSQEKAG